MPSGETLALAHREPLLIPHKLPHSLRMRIKFWGVRGSLPSPLRPADIERRVEDLMIQFARGADMAFASNERLERQVRPFLAEQPVHRFGGFGGNTPCLEVLAGDSRVIIDAGSGIRSLGLELLRGPCGKGKGEVHLLFTHFHWDHLVGLPFFTPIFIPGNQIHVYAVQPDLPDVFRTVFRKPYFPLNLEQLGATVHYHQLPPREPTQLGELTVTPYALDHPDPCWGYKITDGKKTASYCVDTECKRVSREELGPDLPLYQGTDLMIFDAQYTIQETAEKVDWGHAAAAMGLDLAIRERIPRVIFMHHDPASSDEKIDAARLQAEKYYRAQAKEARRAREEFFALDWSFAQEGLEIEL